ncbi:hypothetical protein Q5P01_010583 [Channa striata]|uniref:G-protein coupled receptors family 1 profile domain-containing protein n=1 Tax=Channa striata TaxID=64152 RepID=A0AA88SRX4_CHASR|nr:hypothetical protein Q5P01_010583 [Channa striata]
MNLTHLDTSRIFLNVQCPNVPQVRHITLHECLILHYMSLSPCRQLHTPTNLLLLSLAVSDCLAGIVTLIDVSKQLTCWLLGDIVCSLYVYMSSIIGGVSVGNMILISVDRHVAICDPLHYPTRVTVTRVKMCVCMCWTCYVVYSGLILKDSLTQPGRHRPCYGQCVMKVDGISAMVDDVLSSFAPVAVIIILYLRVFVVAVSQARAMRSHVAAVTLQHSGTVKAKKSELKAARTLGVVVLVFLICFCPYYSRSFVPADSVDFRLYSLIIYFLLNINPSLNPLIYALFYPWFRKSIRLILSLQILQPGSRETNML